ncbi:dihydrolipoyl dehydrogenase [Ureibacillus sp. FSL K6-8385]|uniref:Dihydrolipoyl dehydrogenase n=1 Tax=Ureibacillus terrenus TaxID=118246 RepID=A0A540V644_9BACL|nr:dihydrolipoyl dehydrogenase [Ureibacillus terrenus]MED3660783.1 dihydrolipoyl dehydrogenase [Ureibacillus terrenus]MED3762971.1 dihydrolipoyl dehydrogenase [Ureibacillus terrenus]TQE92229.1 dihydrolipoyl dehydrogenase [Ureibacillus terrenus]
MAREYDVVVIGGGTGGYVAAIRAAQLGMKTAVVEKEHLGGTCLHKGCIPTKTFLRSAEIYRDAKKAKHFGVQISKIGLNLPQLQQRKQNVIEQLHQGIRGLMKKGKIDCYYGTGRLLGPSIFSPMAGGTVSVEMNDGSENVMLLPKHVILATGAKPRPLKGIEFDGKTVLNSDHLLELKELPKSIIIVGGGVIGIEWASCLNDFGVQVTVLEYGERILPQEDASISKEMEKQLIKRGIEIVTNAEVSPEAIEKSENAVTLNVKVKGDDKQFIAEKMLISIGRIGNVENIGLENTEIETESSFIKVNDVYQTKEKHIYAIGDCIGGAQLAHVAASEAIAAVEHIASGKRKTVNYRQIPRCVYSFPEVASIGLTEEEAKSLNYDVKIGSFPFKGVGKAVVQGDAEGFVKIIADKATDDLLGVHMIGPHVTNLISEASLALLLDATPWEIGEAIHPHPSLSEVFYEAALAVDGKAIHF